MRRCRDQLGVAALNIGGQPVKWIFSGRENGRGHRLEKWTRHGVAFNYPYLQWGLLCNWTRAPMQFHTNAWEQLGDNCQENANKHFFTDKRIGKKKGSGPDFDTKK